jgi:hypothetical protein
MPRLPAPEDYGVSTPRPSRGVTEISPVQGRPDLATGKAMIDIGTMMQQEAEKVDEAVALDALNQLQAKHLDLTYGDNGFTKLQGKQVVDRPITKEYSDQVTQFSDSLAATISSPAARAKFQHAAASANNHFKQKLFVHSAGQIEKMQEDSFKGSVVNAESKALLEGPYAAVQEILPVLEGAIQRTGMDAEKADAFRKETLGRIYSAGIQGLLKLDGKSAEAKQVLEDAKPWMTAQQVEHFAGLVKTQNDYDMADSWVAQARAENLTATQAYDKFKQLGKGNKEAVETARGQYEHYIALKQKEIQETAGVAENVFASNGMNSTAMKMAMKTPEFMALPPSEQAKRREHWTQAVRATTTFGQHQEAYWEARKLEDPETMVAFMNLSNSPETLATYSDGQLLGTFLPIFGKQGTAKIIAFKHQAASAAKGFKIPDTLINQAIPEPLQKATGDTEVMQRNRFKGLVSENLMDWKLANPGKVPSQEEQDAIVRSALDKVQAPGVFGMYFGGSKTPVYEIKPMPPGYFEKLQSKAPGITRARALELWSRDPQYKEMYK